MYKSKASDFPEFLWLSLVRSDMCFEICHYRSWSELHVRWEGTTAHLEGCSWSCVEISCSCLLWHGRRIRRELTSVSRALRGTDVCMSALSWIRSIDSQTLCSLRSCRMCVLAGEHVLFLLGRRNSESEFVSQSSSSNCSGSVTWGCNHAVSSYTQVWCCRSCCELVLRVSHKNGAKFVSVPSHNQPTGHYIQLGLSPFLWYFYVIHGTVQEHSRGTHSTVSLPWGCLVIFRTK